MVLETEVAAASAIQTPACDTPHAGEPDGTSSRSSAAHAPGGDGKRRRRPSKTSTMLNLPVQRQNEVEAGVVTSAEASKEQLPGVSPSSSSALELYFERQEGAWCGMHALNNYLGGPYVNQDDCRRAARRVVSMLVAAGSRDAESLGDAEKLQEHIDFRTGFLSIQVINVLGAGLLGLHVEEASTSWECCQAEQGAAAFVNWNNQH